MKKVLAYDEKGQEIKEDDLKSFIQDFLQKICPKVEGKRLFPLNEIFQAVNAAYYLENANLGFESMGQSDTILPRAKAAESDNERLPIHEIGPGNFHFSNQLLKNIKHKIDYHAYDFTTAMVNQKPDEVQFHTNNLEDAIKQIDGPANVLMIELLDDTNTDFYVMKDERLHRSYTRIHTRENTDVKLRDGSEISSVDVHKKIEKGNLYALTDVSRESLSAFELNEECKNFPFFKDVVLENSSEATRLNSMVEELVYEQASLTKDFVTIPVAGIQALWEMRNKDVVFDIFDYGYVNPSSCLKMNTSDGEMTAPVNFSLLREAAIAMGYSVKLETDDDYIKEQLGIDTVSILYVHRAFKKTNLIKLQFEDFIANTFEKAIHQIEPEVGINIRTVCSYRMPKKELIAFNKAWDEIADQPLPKYKTGRYHLKASTLIR